MRDQIAAFATNSANILAGIMLFAVLFYSLWVVVIPPIRYIIRTCPLWSSTTATAWWTTREWVVVFVFVNGLVFVWSLYNALRASGESSFWAVCVDNVLTGSQIAAFVWLLTLVVEPAGDGRPVIPIVSGFRTKWMFAMSLGFYANGLALLDSIGRYATTNGGVGPIHFWMMWLWQNIGCLVFFGFLFWRLASPNLDYLKSPRILWLWGLSAVLLLISVVDVLVPTSQ